MHFIAIISITYRIQCNCNFHNGLIFVIIIIKENLNKELFNLHPIAVIFYTLYGRSVAMLQS